MKVYRIHLIRYRTHNGLARRHSVITHVLPIDLLPTLYQTAGTIRLQALQWRNSQDPLTSRHPGANPPS